MSLKESDEHGPWDGWGYELDEDDGPQWQCEGCGLMNNPQIDRCGDDDCATPRPKEQT